jgi:hypothetical protein
MGDEEESSSDIEEQESHNKNGQISVKEERRIRFH